MREPPALSHACPGEGRGRHRAEGEGVNAPLPHWPRLLCDDLAAAYLGLSATTFRDRVERREFPQPIQIGRRKLWDRRALDRLIDARSGFVAASRPGEGWED